MITSTCTVEYFEGEVGFVHAAVFHHESRGIAQGLLAADGAIHQSQIFRMPAEIFAVENDVMDGDVLRAPEGILGGNLAVADHDIADILKRVVAGELHCVDLDVGTVHEDIVHTAQIHIAQADVIAVPQRFGRIGEGRILDREMRDAPEHLRRLDPAIAHGEIARIPDGGTGVDGEKTILDGHAFAVPERVLAHEFTIACANVSTVLECQHCASGRIHQDRSGYPPVPHLSARKGGARPRKSGCANGSWCRQHRTSKGSLLGWIAIAVIGPETSGLSGHGRQGHPPHSGRRLGNLENRESGP
ncbi:hypothetical protein [Breoghania sp.]|uniref:hypothetical protein n=1 Tax=Breoghania sp. TaxID=2065378 RepID=UPI002633390A|nr:hypothetical protein [Breoghania sp.]MDJ0930934.1 hypothetical protein [Breoghania sp.]